MHHLHKIFPFSAIVGQDLMKKVLLANTIDTSISGVLIKGDKGTGKSTIVRSLTEVLPYQKVVSDCPFHCHPENLLLMCHSCQDRYKEVGELPWDERKMEIIELPVSATEDMVVGSLDIKRAIKEGEKAMEPGILARANRNILYIDEVNLLDNHIINVLLDAAAMGTNVVEREGISVHHPAKFILIGTMNPEEGDLRPQILDRFGMCVEVNAIMDKEERMEIVRRKRLFDSDPYKFDEVFEADQQILKKHLADCQRNSADIQLTDDMLELIVHLSTSLGIKTHRADIMMEKVSKAFAVLNKHEMVTAADVQEAAELVLQHRIKQNPFDKKNKDSREAIKEIFEQLEEPGEQEEPFEREGEFKKKNTGIMY